MLELADLAQQLLVVGEKWRAGFVLAGHERLADEDFSGARGVERTVVHAPLLVNQQAVERRALEGHHLRRPLFPMRIAVRFFQQVRADALEPCRLDVRDRAREQPRGLDQFGRHDPAPGLLQQRGARPDVKPDAARSKVRRLAALGIEHAAADIAQQARQQRQMHLLERRRRRVQAPALLRRKGR